MNYDELRAHAAGRWPQILTTIGIPADSLTNKHKPCPCCGGKDRFRFDDNGKGNFICSGFGNGGGDGFHLVQHFLDCDFKTAAKAVSDALGITKGNSLPKPCKRIPVPSTPTRDKRAYLSRIWKNTRPILHGDPVSSYLEGRGIDWLAVYADLENLHYHPSLPYWHNREHIGSYPAMIGLFSNGHGQGLHITYLNDGHKLQAAYHGEPLPAKKMRSRYPGALRGAAIRLYPPTDKLAVCEGIETALAVREITGWPVWACGSTNGLQNVILPPIKELAIYCDHDAHGQGWQAGNALADRALKAGITCHIWMSKTEGFDALDELKRIKEANHG